MHRAYLFTLTSYAPSTRSRILNNYHTWIFTSMFMFYYFYFFRPRAVESLNSRMINFTRILQFFIINIMLRVWRELYSEKILRFCNEIMWSIHGFNKTTCACRVDLISRFSLQMNEYEKKGETIIQIRILKLFFIWKRLTKHAAP